MTAEAKVPEPATLVEHQAELLARLARGGDRELLRELVRTLGAGQSDGHVCVDLRAWCDEPREPGAPPRPDLDVVRRELLATGVVGDATEADGTAAPVPLLIDGEQRLYARRHLQAERRIASFVQRRLSRPPDATAARLRDGLEALDLLPERADTIDWQLAAVVAGAARSLTVLCGGPGTGKTTTVTRLLSLLLQQRADLRIAVAAPTGKAAARLGEALAARAAERPELEHALSGLEPRTLHRLLGYLPLEDAFRYGSARDARLPYDVVVVDEVSMVDPAIFAELCAALDDDTRLVLVGDKDQLAAVSAGQVLGDLCAAARPELGVGAELAALVASTTGMALPVQPDAAPIANATVALATNHRFGTQPGIGGFAEALMQRRPDDALDAVDAGHDDLRRTDDRERALQDFEPHLLHLLDAARSGDAERALAAVPHARVLTAQRLGPTGAVEWNRRIEARLGALDRLRSDDPFYIGRPILVTANDQQNRIWNGDLGVVGRGPDGAPEVWLPDAHGGARRLNPRRLPAHETAWAMTVHKSQGSEFDHVLLVLPERDGPLLHASLIYTGVTRARRSATICADRELLSLGLRRWPARRSGLADALRQEAPST